VIPYGKQDINQSNIDGVINCLSLLYQSTLPGNLVTWRKSTPLLRSMVLK